MPPSTTVTNFNIPSQIKQKLFLLVMLETVIVIDTEFLQNIL